MPDLGIDQTRSAIGWPVRDSNACSIPSSSHELRNEDAYFIVPSARVAGVYDGMGGLAKGALASRIGRNAAQNLISSVSTLGLDWPRRAIEAGRTGVQRTNASRPPNQRVGSTAVVAAVSANTIAIAWCGDSRAYALFDDGRVRLLTRDHNLVDSQLREGLLTADEAAGLDAFLDRTTGLEDACNAGPREEKAFRHRNIVASDLHSGPIDEVRIPSSGVVAVILTSDGVHDNLCHDEVQRAVGKALKTSGVGGIAQALVDAAQRRAATGTGRAKPDDMTAVTLAVAQDLSGG